MKICATDKRRVDIVFDGRRKRKVALEPNYGGSEARLTAIRMAQLQLICSAHTLSELASEVHGARVRSNVCKCTRPAAAVQRSQYCDIKWNMADETDIFDKSRHLQMYIHVHFISVFG